MHGKYRIGLEQEFIDARAYWQVQVTGRQVQAKINMQVTGIAQALCRQTNE